jgi:exoribonuclease-2
MFTHANEGKQLMSSPPTSTPLVALDIHRQFDALVTGAAAKGTWVRLLSLPVEGKLVRGFEGADVDDRLRVRLDSVDVEQGFIDFSRTNSARHE